MIFIFQYFYFIHLVFIKTILKTPKYKLKIKENEDNNTPEEYSIKMVKDNLVW